LQQPLICKGYLLEQVKDRKKKLRGITQGNDKENLKIHKGMIDQALKKENA